MGSPAFPLCNLRHPQDLKSTTSRSGTLYLVYEMVYTHTLHTPERIYVQGASLSGRNARSQGRMDWNDRQIDVVSRWSNILGGNRRLANAKSSMLQENKRDAACMYVQTSFDTYSDRHVLGLLLCAGVIALCCAVLVVQRQHTYSYILLLYCCCCTPVQRFRPLRSLTRKNALE